MAINLSKGSSINLSKIELKKSAKLTKLCVGLNWGAIESKVFGFIPTTTVVDLDGSAALFGTNKQVVEVIYYKRLTSQTRAIRHSGDDTTGDTDGDDGLDNEVIMIDFAKIPNNVQQIVLFLNSFKQQDFADIPYSKIRIFEGTPKRVDNELARFYLSKEQEFAGHTSMIMAKIFRNGSGEWEFKTIGEPSNTRNVKETVQEIQSLYL